MSTKHLAASISAALALLVAGLMADEPSVRAAFLPGPPGGVLSGGDEEDELEVDLGRIKNDIEYGRVPRYLTRHSKSDSHEHSGKG